MSKSVVIALTALILLILIGGGYFAYSSFQKTNQAENSVMTKPSNLDTPPPSSGTVKQSLKNLMTMTVNQVCSFQDETGNSGTVFSGNGKVRADFAATTDGTVTNTHMISDGTNVYLWFDGAEAGFKMPLTQMEQFQTNNSTETSQSSEPVDVNKQVDFDCQPWAVDASRFTLPELTFQDFGAMMQTGVSTTSRAGAQLNPSDTTAAQCAACDNLPAEAASQCKLALGCE